MRSMSRGQSSALTSRQSSRPMPASAPKPPPTKHVEALDRVLAGGVDRHATGEQADVADVVLRAGVGTAGEMDVDGRVEGDARLHPVGDRHRRALGVGERRTCSRCCPCRRSGRRARWWPWRSSPISPQAPLDQRRVRPRRCRRSAGSARRSGGYRRRPARARCRRGRASARLSACPTGSATPTQTRPGCFCGMEADVRLTVLAVGRGRPGRRRRASAWRPSFASTSARNLSKPQASSTYFRRAFLRSVRSPLVDEDAHDGVRHRDGLLAA